VFRGGYAQVIFCKRNRFEQRCDLREEFTIPTTMMEPLRSLEFSNARIVEVAGRVG